MKREPVIELRMSPNALSKIAGADAGLLAALGEGTSCGVCANDLRKLGDTLKILADQMSVDDTPVVITIGENTREDRKAKAAEFLADEIYGALSDLEKAQFILSEIAGEQSSKEATISRDYLLIQQARLEQYMSILADYVCTAQKKLMELEMWGDVSVKSADTSSGTVSSKKLLSILRALDKKDIEAEASSHGEECR